MLSDRHPPPRAMRVRCWLIRASWPPLALLLLAIAPTPVRAAPDCSDAYASPDSLWPPDHKFRPIAIEGVRGDGNVSVTVACVHQDEPLNATGDGNTAEDATGVGSGQLHLRSELQGHENGRVYTIAFSAIDDSGESCWGTAHVGVPKSKQRLALDDGPLYASTPLNAESCGAPAPVNTPPVVLDTTLSTTVDTPLALTLAAEDAERDALAFTVLEPPRSGTLSGTPPTLLYTPAPGFVGEDALVFEADDGQASSAPATLTLEIVHPNRRPLAEGASATIAAGATATIVLRGEDPDGDPLAFSLQSLPLHGAASIDGQTLTYVPETGFTGSDAFTIVATDGRLESLPATVAIEILPAALNRPPIARLAASDETPEPGEVLLDGRASSDPDDDALGYRWRIVSPEPVPGRLELVALGTDSSAPPEKGSLPPSPSGETIALLALDEGIDVVVELVVNDGELDSAPARLTLPIRRAISTTNARPVLVAVPIGDVIDIEGGDLVFLDSDWRQLLFSRPIPLGVEADDGPEPLSFEARYALTPPGADLDPTVGPLQPATSDRLSGLGGTIELGREPIAGTIDIDFGLRGQLKIALDSPERAPSGEYELHVTAFDGELRSAPHVFRFTLDRPPQVIAEPAASPSTSAFERRINEPFAMSVAGSFDPEGGELVQDWNLVVSPADSTAVLTGEGARRSLTPDVEGLYRIAVTMTDPQGNRVVHYWSLQASGILYPSALAEAGEDLNVVAGRTVGLDGRGSRGRREDSVLAYAWTMLERPTGSAVPGTLDARATTTLTPDLPGRYVVELAVTDSLDGAVARDTVTVLAEPNGRPVAAIAGPGAAVEIGTAVTLNGAASSDPDGDTLRHRWRVVETPPGSSLALDDAEAMSITFTVSAEGEYTVELVVDDGLTESLPTTFTLRAEDTSGGEPPVASIASVASSLAAGTTVTLDGRASNDPEGAPLDYEWRLTRVPDGSLSRVAESTSAVTAFVPDLSGAYEIELAVRDEGGNVDVAVLALVAVDDRPGNAAPVAMAGYDLELVENTEILLLGGLSFDPDGDPLQYRWRLDTAPAGSGATITDPTRARASVRFDRPGRYAVTLAVSDGLLSAEETFSVEVVPGSPDLPDDPGLFGLQGLYGVDANGNDVRDDVERMIHAAHGDSPDTVAALNQLARGMYTVFSYLGYDHLIGDSLRAVNNALECLSHVTDGDPDRVGTAIIAEIINTAERFEAHERFGLTVSGAVFVGNPIEDWKDSCEHETR